MILGVLSPSITLNLMQLTLWNSFLDYLSWNFEKTNILELNETKR